MFQKNKDNSEVILLRNISILPDVMIDIIQEYLPIQTMLWITREKYIENHNLIRQFIKKSKLENYIRYMIRRDYDFVFRQILFENYNKWLNIKHYIYKSVIYKNYMFFIKDYCIENESNKCRILVNRFLEEHGLCQNQHKKNINRSIRWKI